MQAVLSMLQNDALSTYCRVPEWGVMRWVFVEAA